MKKTNIWTSKTNLNSKRGFSRTQGICAFTMENAAPKIDPPSSDFKFLITDCLCRSVHLQTCSPVKLNAEWLDRGNN